MSEEVQTEAAPVEEIENAAPAVEESTADQQQEPVEQAQPEAKPEKTFSQEDLDRIVQKRLAKESRRVARMAEIEAENRYLKQQMEAAQQKPEQPQGKPTAEQFSSYEDFLEALADWKADQKLSGLQTSLKQQVEQQQLQQQIQEFEARKQAKLAQGIEKYPDFADVVNEDLVITPVMAEALVESEIGADVAYYLGHNPHEALRISRLSHAAQIRELVKLESKVSAPKVPTKAPPPIKPSGDKAKVEKDPSQMSDAEFAEWRRKQIARRR